MGVCSTRRCSEELSVVCTFIHSASSCVYQKYQIRGGQIEVRVLSNSLFYSTVSRRLPCPPMPYSIRRVARRLVDATYDFVRL